MHTQQCPEYQDQDTCIVTRRGSSTSWTPQHRTKVAVELSPGASRELGMSDSTAEPGPSLPSRLPGVPKAGEKRGSQDRCASVPLAAWKARPMVLRFLSLSVASLIWQHHLNNGIEAHYIKRPHWHHVSPDTML